MDIKWEDSIRFCEPYASIEPHETRHISSYPENVYTESRAPIFDMVVMNLV